MPITIWLILVLLLAGLALYTTSNTKIAEIGRIVFFCSLLVFLFTVGQSLQIDVVRRR